MIKKSFVIRAEQRFEAAHNLREYHGVPEPLHGHSWKIEVFVRASKLDHEGMVIDYLQVRSALQEIVKPWDHHYINDIPPFDKVGKGQNITQFVNAVIVIASVILNECEGSIFRLPRDAIASLAMTSTITIR
ncbi:MAG: 6-carboxytetrahydropterin synthase [Deltaproteobacteria bacterium]|nr:6-carboxytetrahydropterin synthase [Deltaproteobacteria bacterium]